MVPPRSNHQDYLLSSVLTRAASPRLAPAPTTGVDGFAQLGGLEASCSAGSRVGARSPPRGARPGIRVARRIGLTSVGWPGTKKRAELAAPPGHWLVAGEGFEPPTFGL